MLCVGLLAQCMRRLEQSADALRELAGLSPLRKEDGGGRGVRDIGGVEPDGSGGSDAVGRVPERLGSEADYEATFEDLGVM